MFWRGRGVRRLGGLDKRCGWLERQACVSSAQVSGILGLLRPPRRRTPLVASLTGLGRRPRNVGVNHSGTLGWRYSSLRCFGLGRWSSLAQAYYGGGVRVWVGSDSEDIRFEAGGFELRPGCRDLIGRGLAFEREDYAASGAQRIAPADQPVEGSEGSRDHEVVGLMVIFGA